MRNDNGDVINIQKNILEEIAAVTLKRVKEQSRKVSIEKVKYKAMTVYKRPFAFEKALQNKKMSFICEIKKASPSKGVIAESFPYLQIAKEYEEAGASAISCLTEPYYFQGKDEYLEEIAKEVSIPILRKDFIVDHYMVYEAKAMGADAILLICAILTDKQLDKYFEIAEKLGLSVVFEAHDEEEILRALTCGARIIGVNNRNLKTFEMDLNNSVRLRNIVPEEVIFVSESGMKSRSDIEHLEMHGVQAVLIGETLMRAPNKAVVLKQLKGK
ncbi:MAG: indole-3-glycerol phosphate synthase TrpC [Eubacteriales bacterium]